MSAYYCGIDLANKTSSICVLGPGHELVRACEVPTSFEGFQEGLQGLTQLRCIVEASPLAEWACGMLRRLGQEAVIIDAKKAKGVIAAKKKTDAIDAEKLARLALTGWYNPVHEKSAQGRWLRSLLQARNGLVSGATAANNRIRGLLRAHGIQVGIAQGDAFGPRVQELLQDEAKELTPVILPLLVVWQVQRNEVAKLTGCLEEMAKRDATAKRLMTAPGVGPLVALSFMATVDDPHRFTKGDQLAAYLGLVPAVYQSGERCVYGRITHEGDKMLRWLLAESAHIVLHRLKRSCELADWGRALAERKGPSKAKAAVARKLAKILLSLWKEQRNFAWT